MYLCLHCTPVKGLGIYEHIYISLKKKSKQIEILYKNYHQVYSSFCGLQNTLTELFCHALILLVVYVTMSTLQ